MNRKLSTMIFALSIVGVISTVGGVTNVQGTVVSHSNVIRVVDGVRNVSVLGDGQALSNAARTNVSIGVTAVRDTINVADIVRAGVVNRVDEVTPADFAGTVPMSNIVSSVKGIGRVSRLVGKADRGVGVKVFDSHAVPRTVVKVEKAAMLSEVKVAGAFAVTDVAQAVSGLVVTKDVRAVSGFGIVRKGDVAFEVLNQEFVVQSSNHNRAVYRNDDVVNSVDNVPAVEAARVVGKESRSDSSKKRSKGVNRWDVQAQQDMRSRMTGEGRAWSPVEETFRTNVSWSNGWELRWWSFKMDDGRTVWVYHRRSKTTGVRFTSVIDTETGQWDGWRAVR